MLADEIFYAICRNYFNVAYGKSLKAYYEYLGSRKVMLEIYGEEHVKNIENEAMKGCDIFG